MIVFIFVLLIMLIITSFMNLFCKVKNVYIYVELFWLDKFSKIKHKISHIVYIYIYILVRKRNKLGYYLLIWKINLFKQVYRIYILNMFINIDNLNFDEFGKLCGLFWINLFVLKIKLYCHFEFCLNLNRIGWYW